MKLLDTTKRSSLGISYDSNVLKNSNIDSFCESNDLIASNDSSVHTLYDSNVSNISNDLNVTNGSRHWYVIYTKPHSEDMAREQLEKKEIPVFLPRIREVKFRRRRLEERVQPLFPSYIFARFAIPDEYYNVKWARGVRRIVGSGAMPIPLDDSVVIFLIEQADEKGLIEPQPSLKDGDRVRVKEGPLAGLWGVVQGGVDAKGRVKILMDILHAGARIQLPHAFVERF
jgi:transcriptional antiterminator RfaH